MKSAVQQALSKLRKRSQSMRAMTTLMNWRRQPGKTSTKSLIFSTTRERTDSCSVWCLQGLTNDRVIALFRHALKHKNQYVRWAAVEGLKHCTDRKLLPVFIRALRDRSHVVKGVAVDWLTTHGDSTAIEPLERLLGLPSMIKNSPGTVARARKAIILCGQRQNETTQSTSE